MLCTLTRVQYIVNTQCKSFDAKVLAYWSQDAAMDVLHRVIFWC